MVGKQQDTKTPKTSGSQKKSCTPRDDERLLMKKSNYRLVCWVSLLGCMLCLIEGCSKSEERNHNKKYLIQVGNIAITAFDFNKAFEMEKLSYPSEITENDEFLNAARLDFFKQTIEKMIILERAKELRLNISDSELNKAINDIRADYPEEEFEQVLLKSAISYNMWKKELRDRLLMEKVVAKELGDAIQPDIKDMESYYIKTIEKKDTSDNSSKAQQTATSSSLQKKTEEAYDIWIKDLQKKYVIRIDQNQWKKFCIK
jgi:hypothetical protein